jgi:hypothetical protein
MIYRKPGLPVGYHRIKQFYWPPFASPGALQATGDQKVKYNLFFGEAGQIDYSFFILDQYSAISSSK